MPHLRVHLRPFLLRLPPLLSPDLGGGEVLLGALDAYVGLGETRSDVGPAGGGGEVVTELGGEAVELGLAEGGAGDRVGAVGAGDDEGKDEEKLERGGGPWRRR